MAARDAIAELCPEGGNRKAFLQDIESIAWYFSIDVAKAAELNARSSTQPSAERKRAKEDLGSLRQALANLKGVVDGLSPLASSKLEDAVDEVADLEWICQLVPPQVGRDTERGRARAAINEIVRLSERAASLSERATTAIEPARKTNDRTRSDCARRLGRALWRHGGPNRRPTPNNWPESYGGQRRVSPLNELALLVMNPVIEFHGLAPAPSFGGFTKRAEDALRTESFPGDTVFGPIE